MAIGAVVMHCNAKRVYSRWSFEDGLVGVLKEREKVFAEFKSAF